jgi:aconitate hydratase
VLELSGPGVRALSTGDRLRIVSAASWLGLSAALFPSDDTTRAALHALGREADWKATTTGDDDEEGAVWSLRLEDVEPMMAPAGDPRDARRVIGASGTPVAAVWFGRRSTLEDVRRFAQVLGGRRVPETLQAWLEPDSRAFLEACEESGWIAALDHAGVRVGTPPPRLLETPGAGLLLATGVDPREALGTFLASPWTCALAAREGVLRDPREAVADAGPTPDFASGGGEGRLHAAPRGENANESESPDGAAERRGSFPMAPPLDGPLRGMLLLCGENLPVSRILPWGARLVPEEGDVGAFARRAFSADDPGFAERARRAGTGFVAARGELGGGSGEGERAALALAALGVRATFAGSYDPAFRARLVRAGILPLRMVRPADLDRYGAGDELEVPPATLDPGAPLAVRNLTRGVQSIVHHDLDDAGLECVIAGGLLAQVAGEALAS